MPEPDLTTDQERLAQFLARKDAYDHQIIEVVDGEQIHRTWDHVPEMGREEYRKDAEMILKAIMLMGYGPARLIQHQLLDSMATTIRRDRAMPRGIKSSLTQWIKDLKRQIDANQ